jgi:hypothetical protein
LYIKLMSPEPWPKNMPIPVVKVDTDLDIGLPDYWSCGPLIVVSSRLKAILEAHKSEVEFLPAEIHCRGRTVGGNHLVHLLKVIDCIDAARTVASLRDGRFEDIEKLALDESRTEDSPLFLVDRTVRRIVCVGSQLASHLREAKLSGVQLLSAAEWKRDGDA